MFNFFSDHGYGDMEMEVYEKYLILSTPSIKQANQFIQEFNAATVNKCKLDVKSLNNNPKPNDQPFSRPPTDYNYDQFVPKQPSPYGRDPNFDRNSYYDRDPSYLRENPPRGRDMGYPDYPPHDYPPPDYPPRDRNPRNYNDYNYREKDYPPPPRDKFEPPRPEYRQPNRDFAPYPPDPRYYDDYSHDSRKDRVEYETKTIKITNLPDDCNETDLFRLFYPSGFIRHVERRGDIGYIQFDTVQDARKAIREMDGYSINNKLYLRVEYHPDIPWLGLPRLYIPLYLIEKDGSITQKTNSQ